MASTTISSSIINYSSVYGDDVTAVNYQEHLESMTTEEQETRHGLQMAIFSIKGRIGAAYYDRNTATIKLLADQEELLPDHKVLKQLLEQIKPDDVILSAKNDIAIFNVIKKLYVGDQNLEESDEQSIVSDAVTENSAVTVSSKHSCPYPEQMSFGPAGDFNFQKAQERIWNIDMPCIPPQATLVDRQRIMADYINVKNVNTIRALGGLLKHLDRKEREFFTEINGDMTRCSSVQISDIRYFTLEEYVTVDDNTKDALQIFHSETHPSVFKKGVGKKEGFSIYRLFNRCSSKLGSHFLKKIFSHPLQNVDIIENRLDVVSYFVNPNNQEVKVQLQTLLKDIKSVKAILTRLEISDSQASDWTVLYNALRSSICIVDIIKGTNEQLDFFSNIRLLVSKSSIHDMLDEIEKTVDLAASARYGRFQVKPGVSVELDYLTDFYDNLSSFLQRKSFKQQEELQGLSCHIKYIPQIGFVTNFNQNSEFNLDNLNMLPDFHYITIMDDHLVYKTPLTLALDEEYGDFYCQKLDVERMIMLNLQQKALKVGRSLVDLIHRFAELDGFIAIAETSIINEFVRPKLNPNNEIIIKNGRHPLQECCSNGTFIPNDTRSGFNNEKLSIITGPNGSGKSIYLKQICLTIYLAQVGCFVPAEFADLPIVDKIFTRIFTVDTIGNSTFKIDLNQMATALNDATTRSLVVIDEFGKGTRPNDGLTLLAGSLKFWCEQGANMPHVFLVTHFHCLANLLSPRYMPQIKFQTFDIVNQDEDFVYLFKLKDGKSDTSFAIKVASLIGIETHILDRVKEYSDALMTSKPVHHEYPAKLKQKLEAIKGFGESLLTLNLSSEAEVKRLLEFVNPFLKEIQSSKYSD